MSDSIWSGTFQTIEEALEMATLSSEVNYDSEEWFGKQISYLLSYRETLKQTKDTFPQRSSTLPFIVSFQSIQKILDFGGSSGWVWDYLCASSMEAAKSVKNYCVYEFQKGCETFEHLHSPPVSYSSNIDDLDHFNLVYCNSVHQYLYKDTIWNNLIDKTSPPLVLIDDFYGHWGSRDFFSLQKYRGEKIAVRFYSIPAFIKTMEEKGYVLKYQSPYISGYCSSSSGSKLSMAEIPSELSFDFSSTLLFSKK